MVAWKGTRKGLTVFLFLLPTLIGILIFNVYPIVLNTYTSFTNRNKFRPNPDCNVGLTGTLDPLCWPMFRQDEPRGLGSPYKPETPLYKNYADLMGKLFTGPSILALAQMVLVFVPLIVAGQVNKRFDRMISRPVHGLWVWAAGIAAVVILAVVLNLPSAFDTLMRTGDFLIVVLRTILFVILRVPLTFILGLVLALILNQANLPGKTFFRVLLFVPWAASSVAILVALIWQFIFRDQGVINQLLAFFGVNGPVWLSNPFTAFGAVVLADIWFSYPFFMVSILGALQSIAPDQYEAAEMDGASWWQQLTNITLPLIRPAVLPAAVLTSITAFQMFGTAFAMTGGGPQTGATTPGYTEFVMVYAYRQIFQLANYGRATAFAVIIFILLFAATLLSLRVTKITKGAYE